MSIEEEEERLRRRAGEVSSRPSVWRRVSSLVLGLDVSEEEKEWSECWRRGEGRWECRLRGDRGVSLA